MAISVTIATRNSARHIGRVLESVRNFDEVVVCDLGSTDGTLEIVSSKGVRIIPVDSRESNGISNVHDYAINHTLNDWVLVIRPDEIVPPQLREYLYEFTNNPESYRGLYIPRKNYILNRLRDHSYPDYQLRFFHREYTSWGPERKLDPKISGKVKKIPAPRGELALIKLPRSLNTILANINTESDRLREEIANIDPRLNSWKLFWTPFGKFFHEYFSKGKYRYGIEGYITSMNKAIQQYCTMAKAHEDRVMVDFNRAIDAVIAGEQTPDIPEYSPDKAHENH